MTSVSMKWTACKNFPFRVADAKQREWPITAVLILVARDRAIPLSTWRRGDVEVVPSEIGPDAPATDRRHQKLIPPLVGPDQPRTRC
ncbi:protein of unknown function [Candidatus Nitrospira inopinata]|uniref:Uncharacterized protein n=1 Tax=Candidatus Nitrospira inopinata TaxID=1715989 RepID=A0A0S4L0J8_9BACT|nr:protein of unknown function [Candidatus Nitrospira inopinata]